MRITGRGKSSSEGWGMGFLFVFFPEDESIDITKKKSNLFPSSSSSSSSSSSPSSSSTPCKPTINILRCTASNHLLARAQSTISICALLIFITLLLFTLSTFEPTVTTTAAATAHFSSRRHLSSSNLSHSPPWFVNFCSRNSIDKLTASHALQGLGTLHRRGTKAMNDLIVGHVVESVTEQELRLFLRLLHRSALTSRSDLILVFHSQSRSSAFDYLIREENESFSKLLLLRMEVNGTNTSSNSNFDVSQFVKSSKKEKEWGEPMWGRRIRSNYSESDDGETRLSYGSVVSFVADELDPENSLAGFLDNVPMSLRRWACYPMLLGRVRRSFKHITLVDVKEILLLGDPLSRVRNRSPESVWISTDGTVPNKKRGKKNSVKTQSQTPKPANSALVMGGARGVRRLANAMLTEIVRAATQHRSKNSVSESGLFNQLVGNEFLLKSANVVTSTESIPDSSSLARLNSNSGSSASLSNHTAIRRGNSNTDINSTLMKHICSLEADSSVYSNC